MATQLKINEIDLNSEKICGGEGLKNLRIIDLTGAT